MLKQAFLIIALTCSCPQIFSQDIIFFTDGSEIESKITEITDTDIKYKKFNNIDGPVYTTSKEKIKKLILENGSVEIINDIDYNIESSLSNSPIEKIEIPEKSQRYIIEVLTISGQDKALNSENFTLYGLDFSNALLVNSRKMNTGQDGLLKYTYFRAWNKMFAKSVKFKRISQELNTKSVNVKTISFQENQLLKANDDKIIVASPQNFNLNKLSKIVKDYDLEENDGVGISVIIENLNKYEERVTGYCVFFDIETREILWTAKTAQYAGGKGMTNHWEVAILGVYGYFMKYYNEVRIEKENQ